MGISSKIEKLICYSRFNLRFSGKLPETKTALFDISSIPPNRRLLQIVSQFLYCGYKCYLQLSFKQYIKMDISGREASLKNNVYSAKKLGKYKIIVSDNQDLLKSDNEAKLKIFFDLHIFKHLESIEQNDFFYPITMYRKFLFPHIEKDVYAKALENKKRKIAAVFIGNTDTDYYNNILTKKMFDINTRHEIFSAVTGLSQDILYIPKSLNDFFEKLESNVLVKKIVLLNINDFSIPNNFWFDILLKSDFFIYMAGYIQPYCHNQIESMLAGCIPITQFNRFFIPHFEHKKNALVFDTLEELTAILTQIIQCEYDPLIPVMRENILNYYRDNYSYQSFEKKLSYLIDNKIKYTMYHIATGENHILTDSTETKMLSEYKIRKIQLRELEILSSIVAVLEKHNLRYYLFFGTLLGAVRHQGFIPWDDDVDIAMPRGDYEKLMAMPDSEFPVPFKLLERRRVANNYGGMGGGGYYELFAKYVNTSTPIELTEAQRELRSDKHLWIDIFPLDGLPKNENDILYIKKKCLRLKKIYRFTIKDYTFKGRILKNICFRLANIFFSKKKLYKKIFDVLTKYPFDTSEQVVSACEMNSSFYIYPHNIFGDERKMLFEGQSFPVPEKSEKYLEFQYGDYLKLPPENERESHSFILHERII